MRLWRVGPGMIEKLSPARFAFVVAMLTALWLAMLLTGAGEIDRAILVNLYAADYPWVALAGIGLTRLGDWVTVVAVTLAGAAWLAYRGQARDALVLLVASFSGRSLVVLQKAEFARLRPQENIHLVEVHYLSFPSGHSANSMIAYLCLALLIAGDSPRRPVVGWGGDRLERRDRRQPRAGRCSLAERRRRRLVVRSAVGAVRAAAWSDVEADQQNVAVGHDIILAFGA